MVIFEISILQFVESKFLTHTVSSGTGSAFSEDASQVLGPLHKVWQTKSILFDSFESQPCSIMKIATKFCSLIICSSSCKILRILFFNQIPAEILMRK